MPRRLFALALALGLATPAFAGPMLLDDFADTPQSRWDYVSDRVMGGVSDGKAEFGDIDGRAAVRLTGTVSTENNGGFIQVRRHLDDPLPSGTQGLTLNARGNGQTYFVHIRTTATTRPWFYYQAEFSAGDDWQDITLPMTAFKPSHAHLPQVIDPQTVTSVGIVAYGRDHSADLTVSALSLY